MARTWLISGCSSGLGRAIAEAALAAGDRVAATARDASRLPFAADYPETTLALPLDVTRPDQVDAAVAATLDRFGRIDVLVNNAGFGIFGAIEETTDAETRRIFETNVFGLLALTRRVLPVMRRQQGGHILMMSSVSGLTTRAGGGLYSATKFAVEGLSEALAEEVAPFGIRVTILEPGPFRTDFSNRSLNLAAEMPEYRETAGGIRRYYAEVDGRQPGDPERAARAILGVVGSDAPPLRLLLGRTALDRLAAKRRNQEAEIEAWRDVTTSVDFDD